MNSSRGPCEVSSGRTVPDLHRALTLTRGVANNGDYRSAPGDWAKYQPKCDSRIVWASPAMMSQPMSGILERVTKSAVMKMLVTPSMARSADAITSSVSSPAANVFGPPTSFPTENLSAFGLGVELIVTGTEFSRLLVDRS